jgi:hypothetical protein
LFWLFSLLIFKQTENQARLFLQLQVYVFGAKVRVFGVKVYEFGVTLPMNNKLKNTKKNNKILAIFIIYFALQNTAGVRVLGKGV